MGQRCTMAYCEAMSKGKKVCWARRVGLMRDVGISNGPRTNDAVPIRQGIENDHDEGVRQEYTE
ncbi:UNVERIFIED_CONTAM: hypothetical protein Sradi_4949200 [Sesamum radiatum]|uniref:Uncharacterized protein n=1 Tax=Sesamum radiatum TaxID=300843 RepID=A0AAW2MDP2_SESRA